MEDKYEEGIIKDAEEMKPLEDTDQKEKGKCICKINGSKIGTGFFCKVVYQNKLIPVLITNYHVIDDNFIESKDNIKIYINEKYKIIKINKNNIIYLSRNNEYDIIIIRLEEDDIENYLEIDENIFSQNSELTYKDEPIYILHHPKADKAKISYGNGIEKINEYDIKHLCNTEEGSSGSPILSAMTNKIIGLHKAAIRKGGIVKYNLGTFLKYPLSDLNSHKNEIIYISDKQDVKEKNNIKILEKNEINKKKKELDNEKDKNIKENEKETNIQNEGKKGTKFVDKFSNDNKNKLKIDQKNKYKIEILKSLEKPDISLKFLFIGDQCVGKTTLLYYISCRKEFDTYSNCDAEIITIKINDKIVRVEMDNFFGQERYFEMVTIFAKSSQLIICVYAINDRKSFEEIQRRIKYIKEECQQIYHLILIGSKSDLEDFREVSSEEGENLAKKEKMDFFMEISCKNGHNIENMFFNALEIL